MKNKIVLLVMSHSCSTEDRPILAARFLLAPSKTNGYRVVKNSTLCVAVCCLRAIYNSDYVLCVVTMGPAVQRCCSVVEVPVRSLGWGLWRFAGLVATGACLLAAGLLLEQSYLASGLLESTQLVCRHRQAGELVDAVTVQVRNSRLGHPRASSHTRYQVQVIGF